MAQKSRKIGALWLRTSKGGMKYYSGVIETLHGDIQIAVFQNDRKEKDNHPDFNIVLSGDKKEKKQQGNTSSPFIPSGAGDSPKSKVDIDKDEIPVIEEDEDDDDGVLDEDGEIDVSKIPF